MKRILWTALGMLIVLMALWLVIMIIRYPFYVGGSVLFAMMWVTALHVGYELEDWWNL